MSKRRVSESTTKWAEIPRHEVDQVDQAWQLATERLERRSRQALKQEIARARRALKLLCAGVDGVRPTPGTLKRLARMSDVEVLKLKYDLRDFLRHFAALNAQSRTP